MNDVKKELTNLFGTYTNYAHEIYQEFMDKLNYNGLSFELMFKSNFRQAKPDQTVPFEVCLPQTHSRIITSNFLKTKNEKGELVLTDFNLRHLLSTYFIIFEDDEVILTISYYNKKLVEEQGKVSDIKFLFDDILKDSRVQAGDLLTVNIQLIKEGELRKVYEAKADFFNTEEFGEKLSSKEYLSSYLLKIKDVKLLKERLTLFQINSEATSLEEMQKDIENIIPTNFDITEVNQLEAIVHNLPTNMSNEELLNLPSNDLHVVNLVKMHEWLTRNDDI